MNLKDLTQHTKIFLSTIVIFLVICSKTKCEVNSTPRLSKSDISHLSKSPMSYDGRMDGRRKRKKERNEKRAWKNIDKIIAGRRNVNNRKMIHLCNLKKIDCCHFSHFHFPFHPLCHYASIEHWNSKMWVWIYYWFGLDSISMNSSLYSSRCEHEDALECFAQLMWCRRDDDAAWANCNSIFHTYKHLSKLKEKMEKTILFGD